MRGNLRILGCLGLFLCSCGTGAEPQSVLEARVGQKPVVLLIHGMNFDLRERMEIWGSMHMNTTNNQPEWDGLIGYLEKQGYRFGGTIRPATGKAIELPAFLETKGIKGEPHQGNLFSLEFSKAANTDGIVYKTAELAEVIKQLQRYTGCRKVHLVAYSAGGLVARAYLQNALPGVTYNEDVDRLITLASPHLGCALATHLGDLLGTRATSIKPQAKLIQDLNQRLDLPTDVRVACVIVRGFAADVRGEGKAYDNLVDHEYLKSLPVGFRLGGDQVVHVRSQNLRLADCGRRYEAVTAQAVHQILVRVHDPSPRDLSPWETRVHEVLPKDPVIMRWTHSLLSCDDRFWSGLQGDDLRAWIDDQARLCAEGIIEDVALKEHRLSEVVAVDLERLHFSNRQGSLWSYDIRGSAQSRVHVVHKRNKPTQVEGYMNLTTDRFGRVIGCDFVLRNGNAKTSPSRAKKG